ncbi:ATP-binding cassette domain-containing protein [Ihubacter sp. rT4E-8]|uniref:ATP-binding cassette domain-containing protein n=1 Tax=unclassified Ihubacter TaxID=2633299 RepID=UPI00137A9E20
MLEIRDVHKTYGRRGKEKKKALNGISLTLTEGVYGLLGPNGAGKSTLMNIITDNLQPDQGEILWNGESIRRMGKSYRKLLGYGPQQQGLYESFSGRRFLAYMGTLKELPSGDLTEEIQRAAAWVNLETVLDRSIGSYSGGMKQRLLAAQALMGNPKLVILDEPTAGLDPKERVRLREKIAQAASDRIILIATHVVSDVESIAKEIIILKDGKIHAQGSVEGLCDVYECSNLEALYMEIFEEEHHV